jgi:hypothetical protein
MRPESWVPRGAQPKSRAVHGRRLRLAKQATEELHRVGRADCSGWRSDRLPLFRGRSDRQSLFRGRSDRLGSRSDCQPLFHGRFDRLSSRSDHQPLFCGRSDRLGSQSDRQPLFRVRSDLLGSKSDRQQRSAVKNPVERGAPAVVRAWEPLRESHPAV